MSLLKSDQSASHEKERPKIPEYELKEGVDEIIRLVKDRISTSDERLVVEIAGGSASGKTSAVADRVKNELGDEAVLISMDDYYRGATYMKQEEAGGNILNWDQPEALNLNLLKAQLAELKSGKPIQKPIYDFKAGEPTHSQKIDPKKVIIVEGLFALNDTIEKEGDIKAFVDIGTHGRILRRLLRDIERTGQRPQDILNYFSEVVEPMHDKYIQSSKKNADMIVKNEYKPNIEAQRSGMSEVQIKFKSDISPEILRKAGAERLISVKQTDNYYNPKDRNLSETGEILRIRDEGSTKILTYKGPKAESSYRQRPKFEFEINEDIEKRFLAIYGDRIKIIKKERTLYQLDGIIFSVDMVKKLEEKNETDLGTFLEIRSTDTSMDDKKIRGLIQKLGLKFEDGIKESYAEM